MWFCLYTDIYTDTICDEPILIDNIVRQYQPGLMPLIRRSVIIMSQYLIPALVLTGLEKLKSETQNEGMHHMGLGENTWSSREFPLGHFCLCLPSNEGWRVL